MKISEGLDVLEIPMNFLGSNRIINPVLISDSKNVILVDTGLPGQLEVIREAIEKTGAAFEKLNRVIITHQDMDHIGSLASIQRELGGKMKVMAHPEEKPYIEFEKRPIKMTPERMAQVEASLQGGPQGTVKEMIPSLKSKVDETVVDDEELPYCGGIKVIHTPGHTPGHISLYLVKYKTLIAGDALNVADGKLFGPNPQHTYNMEQAAGSLKKLLNYDIQTVLCYHGGIYNTDANTRIAELSIGG